MRRGWRSGDQSIERVRREEEGGVEATKERKRREEKRGEEKRRGAKRQVERRGEDRIRKRAVKKVRSIIYKIDKTLDAHTLSAFFVRLLSILVKSYNSFFKFSISACTKKPIRKQ